MLDNTDHCEHSRQQEQLQQPKPAPGACKAAIEAQGRVQSYQLARELERLAMAIEGAKGFRASVQVRLQFLVRAVELGSVSQLNELGSLIPFAWLSERTLDRVFEDGCISEAVVSELLARTSVDAGFAAAVAAELGEHAIEGWRAAQRQGALL